MTARSLGPMSPHAVIPAPLSGYGLPGRWSVVVPADVDITQIVSNPSVETNTTGYTAVGGSIARSTEKQYAGAYSLKVTPTAGTGDGVFYGTVATTTLLRYPWSFAFYGGAPGAGYKAYWATTGGVQLGTAVKFRGAARWQRIQVPWEETTTTTRRLYVVKDGHARVNPFYVDAMLVPNPAEGVDVWRYFDGDTAGFVPNFAQFYWTGTPHGSTSVMRANTRAGGRVIPLSTYGFTLIAMLSLGLPTPNNISIPLALPGGEAYQRTLSPAHEFVLSGALQAQSLLELQRKHAALTGALDVRRQPIQQPLILQYEPLDDCGNVMGNPVEIVCSFNGGLEGQRDNSFSENVGLRFQVHLPYVGGAASTEGSGLDVRDDLADADFVVRRDANGIWSDLSTGLSATVFCALWMPDGRILVGGDFTNAGGDANADRLAYYDPVADTFSAINATPIPNGSVLSLLLLPDGNVLVGGSFVSIGGDAAKSNLVKLTVATGAYSALGSTPSAQVRALALLPDNTVAVGGDFINLGSANGDFLARYDWVANTFSAFTATPLVSANVNALIVDQNAILWVGGDFDDAGGVTGQNQLTALQGPLYDAFSLIAPTGDPLSAEVLSLAVMSNGSLLVGGSFTNIGGDTSWDFLFMGVPTPLLGFGVNAVALLRNKLFSDIGVGDVNTVAEIAPGVGAVGGDFTTVAGLTLLDRMFQFTGTTPSAFDVDLPGSPRINVIASRPNGEIIVGFTTSGTGYTSGTTTVTNTGSADAFPVITISYSSAATVVAPFYSIRNLTTGQVISFNLSLLPGEVLTIDLRPGIKTVTSSIRGNLNGAVLPGGNLATFKLSPGDNRLNIFIDIASAANASADAWWKPAFNNLGDAWN